MIDYRDLLRRYMAHVGLVEGTAFIPGRYDEGFTAEERAELESLEEIPAPLKGNLSEIIHNVDLTDTPFLRMTQKRSNG